MYVSSLPSPIQRNTGTLGFGEFHCFYSSKVEVSGTAWKVRDFILPSILPDLMCVIPIAVACWFVSPAPFLSNGLENQVIIFSTSHSFLLSINNLEETGLVNALWKTNKRKGSPKRPKYLPYEIQLFNQGDELIKASALSNLFSDHRLNCESSLGELRYQNARSPSEARARMFNWLFW